jgi:hypothetical protein
MDSGNRPAEKPAESQPTWTEQDQTLQALWQKGDSPEAIAVVLGRSVPAVMTRAARLGLPRRFAPGRKARLPDPSSSDTRPVVRPKPVVQPAATEEEVPLILRVCLMCLTRFKSQGPHNRICPRCKDSPEYVAGSRLPDLDLP